MDIEKALTILRKARIETKDPILSEVFKLLTDMVVDQSTLQTEIDLLIKRVEELEQEVYEKK